MPKLLETILRLASAACLLAGTPVFAIGLHLVPGASVVEFHNRILDHYFLTADTDEIAAIDAGAAGPGWQRTGFGFSAWGVNDLGQSCPGCVPVARFYGTPGLGPNSHFYTGQAAEAAGLRNPGSGWTYEKDAFNTWVPTADGTCEYDLVPVYRLYNGRWMFNDSNHRYVTSQRVRAEMRARGWADEGARFCVALAVDVPIKAFNVEIPMTNRILPSGECENEARGLGGCLAVNNLPVPALRAGPYDMVAGGTFGALTGVYSPEAYWAGGGDGTTAESLARGVFVNAITGANGIASWFGIHIDTQAREASSYASINPLYKMRTSPSAGGSDERFFPFAAAGLPPETELSIKFSLYVRRIDVHDGQSHAYGHPSVEFIDGGSGEHLIFNVLAYGVPSGTDYLAPDVATGTVIVGTEFRPGFTPYGRSVGASALSTPSGFQGAANGIFDFRVAREEFQRVIDAARTLNPRLSSNPADYLVDNFHFNNEIVGNAEIGVGVGLFSLRLVARS
jgi:hypothetical protein